MKTQHRWIAFLLSLMMLFCLLPSQALAAQSGTINFDLTVVNPLYAGIIQPEDLLTAPSLAARSEEDEIQHTYLQDVAEAAAGLRKELKTRQETIEVYYHIPDYNKDEVVALARQISAEAMAHTGEPTEGDYLLWQYGGYTLHVGGKLSSDNSADLTLTYTYTYYTTAEEEAQVDAKIAQLLESWDVSHQDELTRIQTIYDYICANVTYDKTHVDDTDYKTQYTAYGALIDGTSVCQGYAVLLYRLALELDVDSRLIAGEGGGEAHGWNIARLGSTYYNLDSTWDAGSSSYNYFLRCEENFPRHVRYDEYDTQEFHTAYPMAQSDYSTCAHAYDEGTVTTEATCTKDGVITYTCTLCGDSYTESLPATGHNYSEQIVEPTCSAQGYTLHRCTACGDEYSDTYTDPVPHDYQQGVCSFCGAVAVNRVAGEDRYQTAIEVADQLKATLGVEKFDAIILAYGKDFPDALAGSYLATVKNAPILLYRDKSLDLDVAYIEENLADNGTVYILGSTAVISADVEKALSDYTVKRLSGDTRYETNLAILEEAGVTGGEILVCTGRDFADSLSASAVGLPILLVNSKYTTLTDSQIKFLEGLKDAKFTIVGSTAAVNEELATALEAYGTVDRVYGDDRYETSVAVAERYFPKAESIVLAYSRNFPDGLCGGPLAYAMGAPLILTKTDREAVATEYVEENEITGGLILGSTAVITEETAHLVFALPDDITIPMT